MRDMMDGGMMWGMGVLALSGPLFSFLRSRPSLNICSSGRASRCVIIFRAVLLVPL